MSDEDAPPVARACVELAENEDRMAERLHLDPPRLLLVDEETAVVLAIGERQEVAASSARARGRS